MAVSEETLAQCRAIYENAVKALCPNGVLGNDYSTIDLLADNTYLPLKDIVDVVNTLNIPFRF